MYEYRCALDRVKDGDTVSLLVDLGFNIAHRITVRLSTVYCPEAGCTEGEAATAFTRAWFEVHRSCAPAYILLTHKDRTERYGRYLGDVRCIRDGSHLNAELVSSGHGTATP